MKIKEKLIEVYDFFSWHGIGQLIVALAIIVCLVLVLVLVNQNLDKRRLEYTLQSHRIHNETMVSVEFDEDHQIIAVGNGYYQGVCELNSVDFDKEGDTCNYWCWWQGSIGDHPRYRLTLPCAAESK